MLHAGVKTMECAILSEQVHMLIGVSGLFLHENHLQVGYNSTFITFFFSICLNRIKTLCLLRFFCDATLKFLAGECKRLCFSRTCANFRTSEYKKRICPKYWQMFYYDGSVRQIKYCRDWYIIRAHWHQLKWKTINREREKQPPNFYISLKTKEKELVNARGVEHSSIDLDTNFPFQS